MSCQSFTDVDSHLLCLPLPKGIGRYQISLSLTLHSGGSHEEQHMKCPARPPQLPRQQLLLPRNLSPGRR